MSGSPADLGDKRLRMCAVKLIPDKRDGDRAFRAVRKSGQVEEGELEVYGAVKVIEEVAPSLEDGGLVLVLAELVVNVLVLDSFGVMVICGATDAVRPHSLKGYAVLRGLFFAVRAICLCDCRLNRFPVCAGQPVFGQ